MLLSRRTFIKSMIAAAAAPAIVKADNIMKIWVPDRTHFGVRKVTVYESNPFIRYTMTIGTDNPLTVGGVIQLSLPNELPRPMYIEKIEDEFNWDSEKQMYTRQKVIFDPSVAERWGI